MTRLYEQAIDRGLDLGNTDIWNLLAFRLSHLSVR